MKKKKSGILIPKTYYQEILSLLFEDLNETERLRKIDYLKRQSMNLVQLQLYWSTRKLKTFTTMTAGVKYHFRIILGH